METGEEIVGVSGANVGGAEVTGYGATGLQLRWGEESDLEQFHVHRRFDEVDGENRLTSRMVYQSTGRARPYA
jgi:hypothetical protein